jgi:hypothetical protein
MQLIRTTSPFSGHGPGTVHIFDEAASVSQWRALCGRRKAKWRAGPFEQDWDSPRQHIEVTCPRCRELLPELAQRG